MNEILLSSFDMEDAVEVFVEEQVEIVGGSLMIYDMIDRAFQQQQIIPFFVKETYLYNWRINFFQTRFPKESWVTEDEDDDAHSDVDGGLNNEDQNGDVNNDFDHGGGVNEALLDEGNNNEGDVINEEDAVNEEGVVNEEDGEEFDELYDSIMNNEISRNFDDLMIFAGRESFENIVFFTSNGGEMCFNFYDRKTVRLCFEDQSFLDPTFMLYLGIPFSQFVDMAVALYPKGPKTLEDGFLDKEVCGQVLWEKSVQGL